LQTWLDIIMEFDFDIRRYKEGRSHEFADYLRRRPMEEENVVKINAIKVGEEESHIQFHNFVSVHFSKTSGVAYIQFPEALHSDMLRRYPFDGSHTVSDSICGLIRPWS
jgi:hypothetical protein